MFRFAHPSAFLLLLLIPLLYWRWGQLHRRRQAALRFSHTMAASHSWATRVRPWILRLRFLVLALCVLALARPQLGAEQENITTEGIDIVLTLDVSSSMLAEDLKPNRIEAAKEVAASFIRGRISDRIGMVIFAGRAYTQCPLTLDYDILLNLFDDIQVGMVEDGTAVGMGLGVALNRLRDSEATSKILVLLTDGRNNRGEIDPKTAAQLAESLGVKIYTIGAGSRGTAPYPVDDPLFGRRYAQIQVDVDEPTLREVAEITGGQYFRATDRESLENIYQEIDSLEKSEIEVESYTLYSEKFHLPLGLGLALLLMEIVLLRGRFQTVP